MNIGRICLYLAVVATLVGGVVTVADAMVITDEERLETFVEALTSEGGDRVGHALRFADPNREPVAVVSGRTPRHFADGQEVELETAMRDALPAFSARELDTIQRAVDIRGAVATVALRVRGDEGLSNAQFDFRRHEDGWLLQRVVVR
jgi:hypothetical protein